MVEITMLGGLVICLRLGAGVLSQKLIALGGSKLSRFYLGSLALVEGGRPGFVSFGSLNSVVVEFRLGL